MENRRYTMMDILRKTENDCVFIRKPVRCGKNDCSRMVYLSDRGNTHWLRNEIIRAFFHHLCGYPKYIRYICANL